MSTEQAHEDQSTNATPAPVLEENQAVVERPSDDAAMASVRDLLFGAAISDLRKEFQQNSRSVLGTVKSLHREFKQRTDDLQSQLDSQQAALNAEGEERREQDADLEAQVKASAEEAAKTLHEQQRELERTASRLGADVKSQQRNAQRALDKLENKVFAALKDYSEELRDGKLNRDDFASMLSTLAGKVASAPGAANESVGEQSTRKSANG